MGMWKQLIEQLSPNAEFQPPLVSNLKDAEVALGAALPEELKALLRETNGVSDEWGTGLIWPLELILRVNVEMRSHHDYKTHNMPFDSLLFFASAGNGDQFAFTMMENMALHSRIFAWNHEDDSRINVAPSLRIYLEWWIEGKIKL